MSLNYKNENFTNFLALTSNVLCTKWKLQILYELKDGKKRFNALRKNIEGITQVKLTSELKELEQDGLILRKQFNEVPPRVEYSLSSYGEKVVIPVLELLNDWGEMHYERSKL